MPVLATLVLYCSLLLPEQLPLPPGDEIPFGAGLIIDWNGDNREDLVFVVSTIDHLGDHLGNTRYVALAARLSWRTSTPPIILETACMSMCLFEENEELFITHIWDNPNELESLGRRQLVANEINLAALEERPCSIPPDYPINLRIAQ